jgi:RNA polymerase sigma factor (sigma-70 family)
LSTTCPASYPTMTTPDLVRAARARDGSAWRELIARYERLVRATVAVHRLQESDAADAVQTTWLRAFERLDTLREPDKLGGWLKTIAVHECYAILRRRRLERGHQTLVDDIESDAPDPEEQVLLHERCRSLDEAVNRLSGRSQHIIRWMFYQQPDERYAELARSMDLPIGSIGPTRQRALRSLRNDRDLAGYLRCRATA